LNYANSGMMRNAILASLLLLVAACGSKSSQPAEPPIVKFGVIAAKKDTSQDQVDSGSRGNTSVYGSISGGSGGGVSIGVGIGVLLGTFGSSSKDSPAVRYDIDLLDGGQITVYHESPHFEVKDCVRITVYPDEQEHPPDMERSNDGCN